MYVRGSRGNNSLGHDITPEFLQHTREQRAAQGNTAAHDSSVNGIRYQESTLAEGRSTPLPQPAAPKKQSFTQKLKLGGKRRTPIVAILVLLFGGGLGIGAVLGPGIALTQLTNTLTDDLNSQLAAITETNSQLWRSRLKSISSGSCGVIKISCKFKTINVEKATKNFKSAGIDVEVDRNPGFGANRGKITKMSFVDSRGTNIEITDPSQLNKAMTENIEFRTAMIASYNPKFTSFKNAAALRVLKKAKTSYSKKLNGTTKEELDNDMKAAVGGKSTLSVARLTPEKDEDGKETGRYVDQEGNTTGPNGEPYTAEDARRLEVTERSIDEAPRANEFAKATLRGVAITGALDATCTLYNTSRAVETAAIVYRQKEMIRFAMVVNNTTNAMQAGDATPEQVQYIGKKLAETDTEKYVVDETAWNKAGSADNPPMVANPYYGKSALDSKFYKMSAYQDVPSAGMREMQFMATGGLVGSLSAVNQSIAKVVGNRTPQEVSDMCKVVQNPIVRGGALAIGIIAGIGSFGWTTALSVAGSLALAAALPYLTAQLADIVAGEVTGPDTDGVDMGNATAVGTSATLNGIAKEQGLMPLSPEEMANYQNINRQATVGYNQTEEYLARQTPFDITNRFSFLGRIASASYTFSRTASQNAITAAMSIPQVFATATSFLLPASYAASSPVSAERYSHQYGIYKDWNIATDPTGVLVYGMTERAMELDPIENTEWLANQKYISKEDGSALDTKKPWDYKKWLEDCIDQQPGAHEDPETSRDNGYSCVDPKNKSLNERFSKYKVTYEVNDIHEGNIPGVTGGSIDNFPDGSRGGVSEDGWAYPTTKEAQVTSPFGIRWGAPHNGVDLAQPGEALNKPIYAARDGKVIAAGPAQGFGNWIIIQHEVDGKKVDTVYGHMYDDGVIAKKGQTVKAGDQIGKIGSNGQSTGPHLHFEVWEGGRLDGGKPIDPEPIIKRAHGSASSEENDRRRDA